MILVDAGPLVAAGNRKDADHQACVAALASPPGPLLVPSLVVAEACYLLAKYAGSAAEAGFLRSFAEGFLTLAELVTTDFVRMAELVERYSDLPLGGADAAVVAIAERLGVDTVMTLDRRHFAVVRPVHVPAFTLLPR